MRIRHVSLLLLVGLLVACQTPTKCEDYVPGVRTKKGEVVQTLNTTVFLRTYEAEYFKTFFPEFKNIVQQIHRETDRYNDYNEMAFTYELNQNYGSENLLTINEEMFDILGTSLKMCELSEGYFNPAIGGLVDLWSPLFNQKTNIDPSSAVLTATLAQIPSYQELNENLERIVPTIHDDKPNQYGVIFGKIPGKENVLLDFGGIAKGYALEKVFEAAENEDKPFMTYAGGSSIIMKGEKPYANGNWIIEIEDPKNPNDYLAKLYLKGTHAISTSGDYQKYFFNENNTRRHHILNPLTGYPENYYRSITLYSNKRADVLDALSTALFNCPDDEELLRITAKVEEYFSMDIEIIYSKEEDGVLYLGATKKASEQMQECALEVRIIDD
ncbi:FAD:protein FMN transferase [bacterium]|jgi:thiamine biosynthesis lipoprotein ApbE|nr:FAD:protein FMN transferase [bacterium]